MQLFFQENIENDSIIYFSQEESQHIAKVLRLNINETIDITDGKGSLFNSIIIDNNPKKCIAKVIEKQVVINQRPYKLHIALAPTKNIERFEWFVEKAVEIGIDQITPIICRFSERKILKLERIEKIIISAMKQSQKFFKPKLNDVISLEKFLKIQNNDSKFIAYCKANDNFSSYILDENLTFLVGPEGGFSEQEFNNASNFGYKPLKINNFRLRTETAGVFIAASVNYIFQK
jgi:16S rRNA (uracil1498-N3)-methyltransferase